VFWYGRVASSQFFQSGVRIFFSFGLPQEILMSSDNAKPAPSETELITFGAGCFWCVEAIFKQLDGVISVGPGYSGGPVANPTYEQVCSKTTGHAEVCQIRFDPSIVTFSALL